MKVFKAGCLNPNDDVIMFKDFKRLKSKNELVRLVAEIDLDEMAALGCFNDENNVS